MAILEEHASGWVWSINSTLLLDVKNCRLLGQTMPLLCFRWIPRRAVALRGELNCGRTSSDCILGCMGDCQIFASPCTAGKLVGVAVGGANHCMQQSARVLVGGAMGVTKQCLCFAMIFEGAVSLFLSLKDREQHIASETLPITAGTQWPSPRSWAGTWTPLWSTQKRLARIAFNTSRSRYCLH